MQNVQQKSFFISKTNLHNNEFGSSFVTNDEIPNNDSMLFYDPSSSTIPGTFEIIVEVPNSKLYFYYWEIWYQWSRYWQ